AANTRRPETRDRPCARGQPPSPAPAARRRRRGCLDRGSTDGSGGKGRAYGGPGRVAPLSGPASTGSSGGRLGRGRSTEKGTRLSARATSSRERATRSLTRRSCRARGARTAEDRGPACQHRQGAGHGSRARVAAGAEDVAALVGPLLPRSVPAADLAAREGAEAASFGSGLEAHEVGGPV